MAFFKFRKGGDDQATTAQQPESIEALRRRAKHRLIGAAVLVLIGVIGFPLLVDKQPRPVAVDIPIEIPDKSKVKPLGAAATEPVAPVAPPVPVAAAPEPTAATPRASEPVAETVPTKPEPKADAKTESKAVAKPEAKAKPVEEGARAQALLEGKASEKAADQAADKTAADKGRFVVQVGAFAETAKAREVRLKVERIGLKTYTHVAETKDGQRTRVRVGPFATRAEAEKAADKIKKLDLPAIILTL